ncbi:sigma-70 family RNA polymerase sigma factor [Bacteroides sp. OttesenSCG-928-J23]|nr:sigma-70 family RNA polymerase sigma factor [Bacteroides sp. OttesenSCG-928-J23]
MNLDIFKGEILPLKDKLFRIALRITCNREEAEDVVQDVMMKMWQLKEEWSTIENKEAYCCMMSRNTALGRLRLKEYQTEVVELNSVKLEDEEIPSVELEKKETRILLRNLISRLPDKEKAVMELRDLESMSYKEVAQMLEITEAQVKINLFRARRKIKDLFDKIDKSNYLMNL